MLQRQDSPLVAVEREEIVDAVAALLGEDSDAEALLVETAEKEAPVKLDPDQLDHLHGQT